MKHPPVVRVFATSQDPDYESPWQAKSPKQHTGSGVVIGSNQILTGAHVIANATFLQIQKPQDPTKYLARVIRVCHDADLALLATEDPQALQNITPALLGELPNLGDEVSVVGFPVGGEEVSMTEGVVSRIEVQHYTHSQRHLLAVTVDAAINEGNSGGPVYSEDKVVGIAFQSLDNAENVGELVPTPIIRQFLDGVKKGKSPRMPGLGIVFQSLENPTLRRHCGGDDATGVLVTKAEYQNTCWGKLLPGDILQSIEGVSIANNGTVFYQNRYRTQFPVLLSSHFVGDTVTLGILRDKKEQKVSVTLQPRSFLVSRAQYDTEPQYFIYGGLVFQKLCRDYLETWDSWWDEAPKEFLYHYHYGTKTPDVCELVFLSHVLADEITVGYEDLYNQCVVSVNGERPKDIADLIQKLETATQAITLHLGGGDRVIIDPKDASQAKDRILQRYRIPSDRSNDRTKNSPNTKA